jgi:hypothetical protein
VIRVAVNPGEEEVAREFFELFKTPWEPDGGPGPCDVYLSTTGETPEEACSARTVLIYCGHRIPLDDAMGVPVVAQAAGTAVAYRGARLPIDGGRVAFRDRGIGLVTDGRPAWPAAYAVRCERRVVIRVGYDLFGEVRALLTEGQSAANARIPTLDVHIAWLRELIGRSGVPLVEIPPVPDGHGLIACLTHDVDHPSIRRHRWDHTTLGFLARASVGSVLAVCRGRASVGDLLTNWGAAARLPLVHLGLARDFWSGLGRYGAIDPGGASTFFVIPHAGDPGQTSDGDAPPRRAARYGARDIADELRGLAAGGCEIGVHGIDAWLDSGRGRAELAEVAGVTGASEVGVRMHWLYGADKTPALLEQAGFAYDSTCGYNETVGYRAGTAQVFKPLGATRLLELPLHVMDTALFYPGHLHLTKAEARRAVKPIIDHALAFGGTVTVNWHDRSLAPERLWGRVYREIVADLASRNAWFPTAGQAVSWFRKRRAARFETETWGPRSLRVSVAGGLDDGLPGLRLRVHTPRARHGASLVDGGEPPRYVDVACPAGAGADVAF